MNMTTCDWCGAEFDIDREGAVIEGADVCDDCCEEEALAVAA